MINEFHKDFHLHFPKLVVHPENRGAMCIEAPPAKGSLLFTMDSKTSLGRVQKRG